jgi:peptidoglycan/xylan/chitin deacetylase (PgdA/CDA1 family)
MADFDLSPRPLNMADPAPEFPWPDGKKSALFVGFDVDAESAWIANNPSNVERLVTVSHGGYEARVGVAKLLELLKSLEIQATFFIPGWTVAAHPAMSEAILRAGHEIAHHGFLHKLPEPGKLDEAIEEIDKGLDALKSVLGVVPVGYRAPSGENFAALLQYLHQRGVKYSSSWRDDIRPYRHRLADGSAGPVEIPVNYAFDDWTLGLAARVSPRPIFGKEPILSLWKDELAGTHAWGGVTTMVLHPQVSGRPMRWHLLQEFLVHAREQGDIWIATGEQITANFEKHEALAAQG